MHRHNIKKICLAAFLTCAATTGAWAAPKSSRSRFYRPGRGKSHFQSEYQGPADCRRWPAMAGQ